jgi:hypothetical protein
MSISVDDLVASLSSSHIGQEALDLAALQVSTYRKPTFVFVLSFVSLTLIGRRS